MKSYSITALAREQGLSRSTLLYYDRIGLLGLVQRELTPARLGGAALIAAGVLLLNFGDRFQR